MALFFNTRKAPITKFKFDIVWSDAEPCIRLSDMVEFSRRLAATSDAIYCEELHEQFYDLRREAISARTEEK
jgi:hypothetical protein